MEHSLFDTRPAPGTPPPFDGSPDPEGIVEDQTRNETTNESPAISSSSLQHHHHWQSLQSRMRSPPFRRKNVSQNSMSSSIRAFINSDEHSTTDTSGKKPTRLNEFAEETRHRPEVASEEERRSMSTKDKHEVARGSSKSSSPPETASNSKRPSKSTKADIEHLKHEQDPVSEMSPFLRLPREIRLTIYAKVHGPSRVINPISKFISVTESQLSARFSGLLRVSKIISTEAATIRYSGNQFDISPDCHGKPRANRRIIAWLKGIGHTNRGSLRHLNLHCELAPGEVLSRHQLERLLLAAGTLDKGDKSGSSYMPGPFYGGIRTVLKDFERNTLLDIAEVVGLLQDIPSMRHLALMMPWEHGSVDPPLKAIAKINTTYDFCFVKGGIREYGPVIDALTKLGPIDEFHFHGFASTALLERFVTEMKTRLINIYLDTSLDDELVIRHAHMAGWRSCKNSIPEHLPGDWSTCLIYKRKEYRSWNDIALPLASMKVQVFSENAQ